jgi:hypothetical protein
MVMHHITPCTTCIAFMLVSHTYIFVIDPVELELEGLQEPAPVDETNPEQEKASLGASNHLP